MSAVVPLFLVLCGIASSWADVTNPQQFAGKVVLVTGGSSGIGYATALSFARAGAKVVLCSRDSHPAWYNGTHAERSINADPAVVAAGGVARWVRADVSDYDQAEELVNTAVRLFGALDIAVNNAAIGGPLGRVDTIGKYIKTEHDPIMNNVYGVLNCLIAETTYWSSAKRAGVVVNTASRDGLFGTPMGTMYGASKHAIIGLTKSVALEFAKGTPQVRVNALAPGLVDTPFSSNQAKWMADPTVQPWEGELVATDSEQWAKTKTQWAEQLPNRQLSTPQEQANVILFLCSEQASYISGSVFSADYGLNAV